MFFVVYGVICGKISRMRPTFPEAKACGIVFCYNEEHILNDTLEHYLTQGIDLVVFNNNSTDSSASIIDEWRKKNGRYPGRLIDVVNISTRGYEWHKILKSACEYMHNRLSGYDWIVTIDADGFYVCPVRGMTLLELMAMAERYGYNVLNGRVLEFRPTNNDDPAVLSPVKRMKYFEIREQGSYMVEKYNKIFRYHPSVDFYSTQGHNVLRDNIRILEKVRFVYKHYAWVSFEHGLKKIFRDRKPRYVERKEKPGWHRHFMGMLPIEKDILGDPARLIVYRPDAYTVSLSRFRTIMEFGVFSDIYHRAVLASRLAYELIKRLPFFFALIFKAAGSALNALPSGDARDSFRLIFREAGKSALFLGNKQAKGSPAGSFRERLKRTVGHYNSLILQEPVDYGYPGVWHFLMTNVCNARCVFCNQLNPVPAKREITLDSFKRMLENIPTESAKAFFFSGGGEPLLCRDLFPIIELVNKSFPWIDVHIRTNGILVGKYADELSRLNISRLEISIHGTEGVNDGFIQSNTTGEIFKGIELLNARLEKNGKNIHKIFYPTLTCKNIENLPDLIEKAARLKVNEISTFFCRFYPGFETASSGRLKREDSLFYHQELYDTAIKNAEKLAKKLKVRFQHEPLFLQKVAPRSCRAPWQTVVVDTDGTVYPCTGGEVWFERKVRAGEYDFGNILKEHAYQFWNNDSYIKIRRTCNPGRKETFVPECVVCHNSMCFIGPGHKSAHFPSPRGDMHSP